MRTLRTVALSFVALALTVPVAAQSGAHGNSVVIDGDAIIVGEPNVSFRPGTVYIYGRDGDGWAERRIVQAPDAERADGFGASMALGGDVLFVGQRGGRVHAFDRDGTSFSFAQTIEAGDREGLDPNCNAYGYCGTEFGIVLAATADWLMIGEPRSPSDRSRLRPRRRGGDNAPAVPAGTVHIYGRDGGGEWVERQVLSAPDASEGDAFGAAIAIDGDRALVGAPNTGYEETEGSGRVYELRQSGGSWSVVGELPTMWESDAAFGSSVSLTATRAIVGAPGAGQGFGAAFAYALVDGAWTAPTRIGESSTDEGDVFGMAVALDGDDAWIGAPVVRGLENGMAHVFDLTEDEPTSRGTIRYTEEQTNTEDSFGHIIAASGGIAAVTASGLDHQAGGVFVYERDQAGSWRQSDVLISPPDALGAVLGEERRCEEGAVGVFDCDRIELYAYVPISILKAPGDSRGVRANDNWGWTDPETGREYALVGRNDGASFVDITDPTNPVLIGDLPKTPDTPRTQLWRDIKTFANHAYIVADGAGEHGMQVFDLTRLRDVTNPPVVFEPDLLYRGDGLNTVGSSHNIIINEETGFAYLTSRGCAGMHIIDINEPMNPTFVGCSDPGGTHDAQCLIYRGPDQSYQGREICLRMAGNRFQISDVTDKSNPVELSTASHPNPAYMHQGWVTEDHAYFIMDDESDVIAGNVETTRTLIWDLSDLEDPVLAKEFMGSLPASAHNLYVLGNFTYQANYKYGLHILDTTDPLNPIEVGKFDTSPYQTGPGFAGAWSTYPFFESGSILVTSMQEGLFVLKKRPIPIS